MLKPDSPVKLSFRNAELVISPARQPTARLNDLLANVTEHNRHDEANTGQAVGGEIRHLS